jgi:acyl carrier protein
MEFELLTKIIVEVLGVDSSEVTMDTTFEDLGADSLDVTSIVIELEEQLDIQIEDEDAVEIKTVGDAVEKIQAAVAAKE